MKRNKQGDHGTDDFRGRWMITLDLAKARRMKQNNKHVSAPTQGSGEYEITRKHTFFAGFFSTVPATFLASPETTALTFSAVVFGAAFLTTAFFFVTPAGLAPLVAVVVLGALLAAVLAFDFLTVGLATTGSTTGNTRGLELPMRC
jgi:VIT1/CCC1 family predicted Fe2+/Mn2+ transporter